MIGQTSLHSRVRVTANNAVEVATFASEENGCASIFGKKLDSTEKHLEGPGIAMFSVLFDRKGIAK